MSPSSHLLWSPPYEVYGYQYCSYVIYTHVIVLLLFGIRLYPCDVWSTGHFWRVEHIGPTIKHDGSKQFTETLE